MIDLSKEKAQIQLLLSQRNQAKLIDDSKERHTQLRVIDKQIKAVVNPILEKYIWSKPLNSNDAARFEEKFKVELGLTSWELA